MSVNIIMIDFTAFSHGQVKSKIWLCEELEPNLPESANVLILGAWYGVLAFMMLTRDSNKYNQITCMDQDPQAVNVAQKILDTWQVNQDNITRNLLRDVNQPNTINSNYNVIINCSCEHMQSDWFKQVQPNQLLCLQTSNRVTDDPLWDIKNPNATMDIFKSKYPMSQILFEGTKVFDYGELCYSRYMLIGRS